MSIRDGVESIGGFLSKSPLLHALPGEALQEVARACRSRALEDGETLWRVGQPAQSTVAVRSGLLKSYAYSRRGRSLLVDLLGPGEWTGLAPVALGGRRQFDCVAAGETELVSLSADAYRALLDRHPEVLQSAHLILAGRYQRALAQLRVRSLEPVEIAVAHRLSDLLERFGERSPGGGHALPLHISQGDLADLLGVSRKAVGACLRGWERKGWVELGYAKLRVSDPEAIAALLETGVGPAA